VHIRDLVREVSWPRTDGGVDFTPLWYPDGRHVAFAGAREGAPNVYLLEADGRQPPTRLEQSPEPSFPSSWSSDGISLVIVLLRPGSGADLAVLDLNTGTTRDLPVNTRFNETLGQLSPDGQWLLYVTNETGRNEVWIADFPDADTRVQVSLHGAGWPSWSHDGAEALFVTLDRQFARASIATTNGLEVGEPQTLFGAPRLVDNGTGILFPSPVYAVAADGRLLLATRAPDPDVPPVQVVVNWPDLMK
jgi:Tol biopolymer transport system component